MHAATKCESPSSLVPSHLIPVLLWDVTKGAVLHREEDATTAEVRSMNMSGVGIAPEIADHPHVVM
jgi:hypothetical protein